MSKISFLRPALNFLWIGLAVTTLSRVALLCFFYARISETPDFWLIFPLGVRTDAIMICYLLLVPVLMLLFLPTKILQRMQKGFSVYFIFFLCLFLLTELATPDFIKQYDTRPNRIFLDYLIYPKEVFGTLIKSYWLTMVFTVILIAGFIWILSRYSKKLFSVGATPYSTKLLLAPLVVFLLVLGCRGSLTSKRPINVSNAVFSVDQLTNCMGLNSLYTVAFAAYSIKNEGSSEKMYGKMPEQESIDRVRKYMDVPPGGFTSDSIPLLHAVEPDSLREKPLNLVIILEESLGAEYVGCLGGKPLTPEIDKLAKQGTLFTNMYATGTRSVRGIEAVVTGFLPSPSESVVKLGNSQSDFYTVADLLGRHGYDTSFIYGGMANFDNMGSFFNGNGFSTIIDESGFDAKENAFHGTWGWSDEDVLTKANAYFRSLKKPFVSLVFSSSNHEPFEFPDGRIKNYDTKKNTVNNAMKYADYAVGKFFSLAQREDYYKNTVFLIIADHNTRTYGKHLVPVHKFHIPALLLGPGIKKGERFDKLCSQLDIQPTVLPKLGLRLQTPMPGRDLFSKSNTKKGRAIMQFHDINAFRVEDQIVIMQPFKKPLQFTIRHDTVFEPVPLDAELAKDALAHVRAAAWMYSGKSYRLPRLRD